MPPPKKPDVEKPKLVADLDVPGLVRLTEKPVDAAAVRGWRFERLADGSVLLSLWTGAAGEERMVSHELFSPEEAATIAAAFTP